MAENLEDNVDDFDVRPKSSQSADRKDGYVWSGKKLSLSNKAGQSTDGDSEKVVEVFEGSSRSQERKPSSSSLDLDLDRSCGHKLLSRSLKQKLQDAVGQCFPIKSCSSRHSSVLSSKRKIHISELMLDKCPFPPKSDLAYRWHFIKRHTAPVSQSHKWVVKDVPKVEKLNMADQSCEDDADILSDGSTLSCEVNSDLVVSVTTKALRTSREDSDNDSEDEVLTLCTSSKKRNKPRWEMDHETFHPATPPRFHTQIDYVHCLVPDLLNINNNPCYWGVMDRFAAEALLDGKPEGTFLLRDSAQEDYLFSVSFRRYSRSLHARIEQWNHNFSFDAHDPCVFHAPNVTGLLEHYKDPSSCMFFEPLLSSPLHRTFPFSLQHISRAVICSATNYDGIDALPVPSSMKLYLKEYHYKSKVRVRRVDVPQRHHK
ncbi:suppressor of cytokine signaling 4 [Gastrophryne carolinensis]